MVEQIPTLWVGSWPDPLNKASLPDELEISLNNQLLQIQEMWFTCLWSKAEYSLVLDAQALP